MRPNYLILVFFCIVNLFAESGQNDNIKKTVDMIAEDNVEKSLKKLESFGTRFMLSQKRFQAADWIKNEFESMGFEDVKLDSFETYLFFSLEFNHRFIDTTTTQVNVVATLPGSSNRDEIFIICGHYDTYSNDSNPFKIAPGADDNATGTVAVVETARAIMNSGFRPSSTIKFIAFAAEELMGYCKSGAEHYAEEAAENGQQIKLVINNDMIGFSTSNIFNSKVNLGYSPGYPEIDRAVDFASEYSSVEIVKGGYFGADLQPFYDNGYAGLYFMESEFNTYNYHSMTDVSVNVDITYLTEVIKAGCAVLVGMNPGITSVSDQNEFLNKYNLYQNFPNPFNPFTSIYFDLPQKVKSDLNISLTVYNILGEKVAVLIDDNLMPGRHEIKFDGTKFPAGTYFYRLTAGDHYSKTNKMILLK